MNVYVQKGLRYCLRLSFTLYCHGFLQRKKNIKAIQISYTQAVRVVFVSQPVGFIKTHKRRFLPRHFTVKLPAAFKWAPPPPLGLFCDTCLTSNSSRFAFQHNRRSGENAHATGQMTKPPVHSTVSDLGHAKNLLFQYFNVFFLLFLPFGSKHELLICVHNFSSQATLLFIPSAYWLLIMA